MPSSFTAWQKAQNDTPEKVPNSTSTGPEHVHKKHPKRNVLHPEARARCRSYSQRVRETNWVIQRIEKSHSFMHQPVRSTRRNVRRLLALAMPVCAMS